MDNSKKAQIYDDCVRESDSLQRVNSKLKSEYAGNISPETQKEIDKNNSRIRVLENRVDALFK